MIVPGSYRNLCSETNQLIWIRESAFQEGRSSLDWRTDLLPAHHSQTKPGEGCPCFRSQSMAAPTDALALRLDCRVRTSRRIGRIFDSGRGVFFVSLVLKSVHNTIVTCKLNFPSLVMHQVNDLLVHQREAVDRLAQLSATQTSVHVPESRLSNLPVDLRLETPLDCQSVVVANACAARLFHIVRSKWHGGAWSWSSTSTFFMSDGTAWVWLGIIGCLDGKERKEHAKSIVVLSMNAFDEPEISQTRPSKMLPQASPVAACLRPEHAMPGAKQTIANCFRFPPLRCLKL